MRAELGDNSQIDHDSLILFERLFGQRPVFMANSFSIDAYAYRLLYQSGQFDDYTLKSLADIPLDERDIFIDDLRNSGSVHPDKPITPDIKVWYPFMDQSAKIEATKTLRQRILCEIERLYEISMDDWPLDQALEISRVSQIINWKKLDQINQEK